MKKVLLLLLAILSSCTPENDNDNDNDNSPDESRLVKREYVSDNNNLEYWYNENQLLSKITDVNLEEDINTVTTFQYDSNNNIIEKQIVNHTNNYTSTTNYYYDNNNRLTSSTYSSNSSFNNNVEMIFTYSNSTITVNIESAQDDSVIILETDNSGLISKIHQYGGYSKFDYDSNGNIILIRTFNNEEELQHTHNYVYDEKINPFYGQLSSIYLPKFMRAMTDLYYGEDLLFPRRGYFFPFLKNNITEIESDGDGVLTTVNYSFIYDDNNYPLNVNYADYYQFDIEYYE